MEDLNVTGKRKAEDAVEENETRKRRQDLVGDAGLTAGESLPSGDSAAAAAAAAAAPLFDADMTAAPVEAETAEGEDQANGNQLELEYSTPAAAEEEEGGEEDGTHAIGTGIAGAGTGDDATAIATATTDTTDTATATVAKEEEEVKEESAGQATEAEEEEDGDENAKLKLTPIDTVIPFEHLIVLHVVTTCDENTSIHGSLQSSKENTEIIEFAFVVLDASKMMIEHTERIHVKPERTTTQDISTQHTGITHEDMANAVTLKDAIDAFDQYIQNLPGSFCFVTHGGWALRIQLPREARDKNLQLPHYLEYCRMFDIKQETQRWQVHHPEVSLRPMLSLKDLCETFHLSRITGRTLGLNCCLSTVKLIRHLAGFRHPDVFVHPIDTNADLQQFKKEESKVVHLAGLPFEVTQGEIDAWFSSSGLRPQTTWMIDTHDNSKTSHTGFVMFHLHEDAMRALQLNGRSLGDKTIEVSPSSEHVIEAAGSMLVPFPAQPRARPTPQVRVGDWKCPSCAFHNFASRRSCYKCYAPQPNSDLASPQVPPSTMPVKQPPMQQNTPSNFTAGDWMCPNYNCNFHNYASRMQCFKCHTPRPQAGGNYGPPPPTGPPNPVGGGGHHHGRPPSNFRPGDWYCPNASCGFQNFASRQACYKCHTPNPNPSNTPRSSAPYNPHHSAPSYGYGYGSGAYNNNNSGNAGSGGGSYYHSPATSNYGYGAPPSHTGGGGPPSGGGGSHGHIPFRNGDWYCPSCNSHNFASRFHCLRCNTARPPNVAAPAPYIPRQN
ncbi:hypothetical protein BCR43DRAFT_477619 [Syncephalastrum racemosum]|uniref:Uncharacterized protein n=1 Tax=Syncephalastrum racemosum TaxID=13706 RepID=A0A1X2H6T4_SYNRA|nr:hypothetical protein BCR43DRAFT_477619 [Syncephalastrum racemosum]